MLQAGDKIKLVAFDGRVDPPSNVLAEENYWLLIGWSGTVVQSPSEDGITASFSVRPRYLVQFADRVSKLNLHCHNEVPNSLWILESDLVPARLP